MADAQAEAGGEVYVYRFDFESPLDPLLRAAHGLDVPFVFDNVAASAAGNSADGESLADVMCSA